MFDIAESISTHYDMIINAFVENSISITDNIKLRFQAAFVFYIILLPYKKVITVISKASLLLLLKVVNLKIK